jgi:hypothetical protein
MSSILIFIIILIIIICFIVGFQIREGFTCESSQVPVFDMKLYTYNCMAPSTSGLPKCTQDQTIIINAPDKTYKCGTIYGDPLINTCSINTNDPTNYLITCDGYSTSLDDTDYKYENPSSSSEYNSNNNNNTNINNNTNMNTKDYSPFIYPTFAPPPCNVVSKLIIKPKQTPRSDTVESSTVSSCNNNMNSSQQHPQTTPNTRMTDYTKSENETTKTYTYESIPFPYLPAFKTF